MQYLYIVHSTTLNVNARNAEKITMHTGQSRALIQIIYSRPLCFDFHRGRVTRQGTITALEVVVTSTLTKLCTFRLIF